jgi:hypothetical protein
MTGWTFQWPESGLFLTGLDVYHSLHCLVGSPIYYLSLQFRSFEVSYGG